MATFTLTTTAEQDRLLAWLLVQYNGSHSTQINTQQLILTLIRDGIQPSLAAYKAERAKKITEAYDKADASVQSQVDTALGV